MIFRFVCLFLFMFVLSASFLPPSSSQSRCCISIKFFLTIFFLEKFSQMSKDVFVTIRRSISLWRGGGVR
jgi:hypothetical protein